MSTREQLFLERVTIPKAIGRDCWEHTWYKDKSGHGKFKHAGGTLAHRFSYLMFNGAIPDDLIVRHTCNNPGCVNPNHLITGTVKDNNQDMIQAGRSWMQKVTHCPQGHEYNDENTYVYRSGTRACKACRKERTDASNARRRTPKPE